jgi:septal ring-binding cell division protein DamX
MVLPLRCSLIFWLLWCGLCLVASTSSTAAETDGETPDKILLELQAEEYSPYADNQVCDDEDDEELPLNQIETQYGNGRMAFLFGEYEVAFKAWEPLAEMGYAKAQAALAWMYHTGNGAEKDIEQAIDWYWKAATQGHAIAQNNLGVFFETGRGLKKNEKAAVDWYRDSAQSGYSYAQYNLGRMYAEGRGVEQDLEEAKYWWRIASRQGIKKASEALQQLEKKPEQVPLTEELPKTVAHAPYHSKPVTKGIAWVKQQAANHYTIQLARSKDIEWILKLAAAHELDRPLIQFVSKDDKGDEWYNLIYGSFDSYQSGEAARKVLPAELQKWSPWLRRFSDVRKLIDSNK